MTSWINRQQTTQHEDTLIFGHRQPIHTTPVFIIIMITYVITREQMNKRCDQAAAITALVCGLNTFIQLLPVGIATLNTVYHSTPWQLAEFE